MQRLEANSTSQQIIGAIVMYSLCSSTLLLANKAVMLYIPYPSIVSCIQIVASVVIIQALILFGVQVDKLEWPKIKAYSFYIVAFVASIYANMKALQNSNVETVIVFRSLSPLAVSIIEYLFMNRQFPSLRASTSLVVVVIGAVVYCMSDSEFALNGLSAYSWVILYFFLITFEMTYGKKLTSSIKMESVWGPVYYCNVLSAAPMFTLGYVSGDYNDDVWTSLSILSASGLALLVFSCIAGTLIGYTSWLCRGMVSATTFTLVGVVNKFITVLLNTFIWEKHSTPTGIIAVCVCLGAGMFYEQAPLREPANKPRNDVQQVYDKKNEA